MIPTYIFHHNVKFDLRHLQERFQQLQWNCQNKRIANFRVRIHCSDHCISEEIFNAAPQGAMCFSKHGKTRMFNADRHQWSLELPSIVDGLFDKPTQSLRLTTEQNWFIVQLNMKHPLPNGEKYYCFLRLRHLGKVTDDPLMHNIHLQIESAYSRSTHPITPHSNEQIMFGRLLEKLIT